MVAHSAEESGSVERSVVVRVLLAHGVEVSPDTESGVSDMMLLVKNDIVVSRVLPPFIGRRTTDYLKRTFSIPIHHFFHPEMAPVPAANEPVIQ